MTKEEFLADIDGWSNHRVLLWEALESLKDRTDLPVLELGCGAGSTPYLRKYCEDEKLKLKSFDSNKEWADKFDSVYLSDWNTGNWFYNQVYGVVLIDEAPGEHRKEAIELFSVYSHAAILIVHDSEPVGWNASDYKVRPLFNKFKYAVDLPSTEKLGAWATALSNTIDVTKWIGKGFNEHKIIELQ